MNSDQLYSNKNLMKLTHVICTVFSALVGAASAYALLRHNLPYAIFGLGSLGFIAYFTIFVSEEYAKDAIKLDRQKQLLGRRL